MMPLGELRDRICKKYCAIFDQGKITSCQEKFSEKLEFDLFDLVRILTLLLQFHILRLQFPGVKIYCS